MPRIIHKEPHPTQTEAAAAPSGWITLKKATPVVGSLAIENYGYGITLPIEGTTSYEGPQGFELTTTDELREAIKNRGFGRVRREFGELVDKVMNDPFGDTNIDAFKDTDAGQWVRLVHEVTGPLADLIPGRRLAIKGTGLHMEKGAYLGPSRVRLHDQFRTTLRAQRVQAERFPDGVNGNVFINEVFGLITYRNARGTLQEWMIMDLVEDAQPVEQHSLAMSSGGLSLGFESSKYPELAEITSSFLYSGYDKASSSPVMFEYLGQAISEQLGLLRGELDDLNGNNILVQQTETGRKYTLIDLQSH